MTPRVSMAELAPESGTIAALLAAVMPQHAPVPAGPTFGQFLAGANWRNAVAGPTMSEPAVSELVVSGPTLGTMLAGMNWRNWLGDESPAWDGSVAAVMGRVDWG